MIASVSSVDVRQMIFNDLDAVLEIEQGNAKHAWSKKQFSDALQSIQVLVVNYKISRFIMIISYWVMVSICLLMPSIILLIALIKSI